MAELDFEVAAIRLKQAGMKLTPQRLQILRILMAATAPLTAQEVFSAVRSTHPQISMDTVYRNLSALTSCGLVNQVNLQNRESARFEFQGERHHHHVVCLTCGRSFCVESCPAPLLHLQPPEDSGFRIVGHAFEVYGYCSRCQPPELVD